MKFAFKSEHLLWNKPRTRSCTLYLTNLTLVWSERCVPRDKVLVGDGELLSHTISKDWSKRELLQLLPVRRRGVRRNWAAGEDRRGITERKIMESWEFSHCVPAIYLQLIRLMFSWQIRWDWFWNKIPPNAIKNSLLLSDCTNIICAFCRKPIHVYLAGKLTNVHDSYFNSVTKHGKARDTSSRRQDDNFLTLCNPMTGNN